MSPACNAALGALTVPVRGPSTTPAFSSSQHARSQGICKLRFIRDRIASVPDACKSFPAAVFAAGFLFATAPAPAIAAANNTSLIDQIHFYQAEQSANSSSERPATPAQLLEAAAAQLGKIETLIGIGQYESARMQLRQGAASTIRLDLRAYDRSQHTRPGSPQAGKAIVEEVETLDAALKKSKPADECRQLVKQLRHDMSELLASS